MHLENGARTRLVFPKLSRPLLRLCYIELSCCYILVSNVLLIVWKGGMWRSLFQNFFFIQLAIYSHDYTLHPSLGTSSLDITSSSYIATVLWEVGSWEGEDIQDGL